MVSHLRLICPPQTLVLNRSFIKKWEGEVSSSRDVFLVGTISEDLDLCFAFILGPDNERFAASSP